MRGADSRMEPTRVGSGTVDVSFFFNHLNRLISDRPSRLLDSLPSPSAIGRFRSESFFRESGDERLKIFIVLNLRLNFILSCFPDHRKGRDCRSVGTVALSRDTSFLQPKNDKASDASFHLLFWARSTQELHNYFHRALEHNDWTNASLHRSLLIESIELITDNMTNTLQHHIAFSANVGC